MERGAGAAASPEPVLAGFPEDFSLEWEGFFDTGASCWERRTAGAASAAGEALRTGPADVPDVGLEEAVSFGDVVAAVVLAPFEEDRAGDCGSGERDAADVGSDFAAAAGSVFARARASAGSEAGDFRGDDSAGAALAQVRPFDSSSRSSLVMTWVARGFWPAVEEEPFGEEFVERGAGEVEAWDDRGAAAVAGAPALSPFAVGCAPLVLSFFESAERPGAFAGLRATDKQPTVDIKSDTAIARRRSALGGAPGGTRANIASSSELGQASRRRRRQTNVR